MTESIAVVLQFPYAHDGCMTGGRTADSLLEYKHFLGSGQVTEFPESPQTHCKSHLTHGDFQIGRQPYKMYWISRKFISARKGAVAARDGRQHGGGAQGTGGSDPRERYQAS